MRGPPFPIKTLQIRLGGGASGLGAVLFQQLKRHNLRRLLVRALQHNQGCLPRPLRLQPSRGAQTPVCSLERAESNRGFEARVERARSGARLVYSSRHGCCDGGSTSSRAANIRSAYLMCSACMHGQLEVFQRCSRGGRSTNPTLATEFFIQCAVNNEPPAAGRWQQEMSRRRRGRVYTRARTAKETNDAGPAKGMPRASTQHAIVCRSTMLTIGPQP